MFSRKKEKITFKDWFLRILLGDVFRGPQIPLLMGKIVAVTSMKYGIAIGAQFPTKVMPIIRQVSGNDAENAFGQMKESLQNWVDSNSETGIELESHPLISEPVENSRFDALTPSIVVPWATYTFFYGLLMGSLHRVIFLEALESSIRLEHLQWENLRENAPPDLMSVPETTYEGFLADAKEMVVMYEKEQDVLS